MPDKMMFSKRRIYADGRNADYTEAKERMKKRIMELMGSRPEADETNAAMRTKSEAPAYESDKQYATVEEYDSKTGKKKSKKKVPLTPISREEFNSYD